MAKGEIRLKKNVHKFSIMYFIYRFYIRFMMKRFYKRIETRNMDNLPTDAPVILAPNHQNAVMDAMAFVHVLKKQPMFVARADFFKKPLAAAVLYFVKILPIFRIRDGVDNVRQNDAIFNLVKEALLDNGFVGIMPEGNHGDQRKLRPLKKGIFRIALTLQEVKGEEPWVKIVPVGLEYGDYIKCKNNFLVTFGDPIEVSDYIADYKENQPKAINKMRMRLETEMRKGMIDIQQEEYYHTFDLLRKVYRPEMLEKLQPKGGKLYKYLQAEQEIVKLLAKYTDEQPEKMSELNTKALRYKALLDKLNLRDWVLRKPGYSVGGMLLGILSLVLLFPVHVLGVITNYLPYKIPAAVSNGLIKDTQFRSSVSYVLTILTFPIFYTLFWIPLHIFLPEWWMAIAAVITFPFLGRLSFSWYMDAKKLRSMWKYTFGMKKGKKEYLEASSLRKDLMDVYETLLK